MFVAGLIGCRGDAYRPEEALSTDQAIEFHYEQVLELCDSPIDFLFAATLPALSEARGIAVVMRETGIPFVLSFVITPEGTLLDGTPIDQAVAEIDAAVSVPPLGYYINCVHPSIVLEALRSANATTLRHRFIGFQANTSALSPEELDGIDQLQTSPPESFAEEVLRVGRECRMSVLGGCCGTDTRHIECIARLMAEK
jgi:homocysteine S-methyltransferase